ncbi:MAG: transcription termination factor NusA [Erysipelotrichaceae bacterium]|nr:transcription termination factor NusA [Erysipelotrichaceae bacterium]MDY6035484.1 transcription termination factor NusA [Bulleidia sp.]
MEIKYTQLLNAIRGVEDDKNVPENIVLEALTEAVAKAFKKDSELQDIEVKAEINKKNKTIDIYQYYNVVEEVEDDELEISLEDAQKIDPEVTLGGQVREKKEITSMSRAAASLAKNVFRQKIREAEKVAVYNEYIDQKDEMVLGTVESVKDKFTLINLGKTVALLAKSAEIPHERLVEGQSIRVVITDVQKETKGSQVLVSRADATLVKRLFEKEVPEIYQGVVEIKSIAREAGERTKMAVYSHNLDVDPIGSCIGPRGTRVQKIIDELHGEKIDIFEWSDDITELVKNALAPAEIISVLPGSDSNSLLVVVSDDQLSLAIGKRGKNARLAVKLTGHKIDIKTREELEDMGKDYDALLAEAEVMKARIAQEAEAKSKERQMAAAKEEEEARLAKIAKFRAENPDAIIDEEEEYIPDEMKETVNDTIIEDISNQPEEEVQEIPGVEGQSVAVEEVTEEPVEQIEEKTTAEEKETGRKHADLEELAKKATYVSHFEKLVDSSKTKTTETKFKKKKKKNDEEEFKIRNKDLEEQIKKNLNVTNNAPIYSEEELAEIEAQQESEEEKEYDIDYDEYEEYYEDDDNM